MLIQIRVNIQRIDLMTGLIYQMFWDSGLTLAKRECFGAMLRTIPKHWLALDIKNLYDKIFLLNSRVFECQSKL
jgi:hypothetical protein